MPRRALIATAAMLLAVAGSMSVAVLLSSGTGPDVPPSSQPNSLTSPPTAPAGPLTGEVGEFDDQGNPLFDSRAVLTEAAKTKGVRVAAEMIVTWANAAPMYARTCHNDAHMLGSIAARLEPAKDVVQYATKQCDFGFIHGVLKATALDSPPNVDPTQLARLCALAPEEIQPNCEHGLGHAIPLRDGLSMTESFEMCARLETSRSVAECVTGASMEFGVNDMIFHDLRSMDPGSLDKDGNLQRLVITPAERRDPCAALRGTSFDGLDVCYRHVHYFWSSELGEDYATFASRCAGFSDDRNGSCYQSLGAWAWYEVESDAATPFETHKALLDRACMQLSATAAQQGCITGYMHTVWQTEFRDLPSICDRLGSPYAPACRTTEDRFRNR
jgi:hypothetical protein